MKNKQLLIFAIIASAIIGAVLYFNCPKNIGAQEDISLAGTRAYGLDRYKCQSATGSPDYLTAGSATSTCILSIPTTINADLNIYAVPSTSESQLQIEIYVSYDKTTSSREWYPLKNYTDSGNFRTWDAEPRMNILPINTSSPNHLTATRDNIPLSDLRANKLKIEYASSEGNAAVYLEVVKEND